MPCLAPAGLSQKAEKFRGQFLPLLRDNFLHRLNIVGPQGRSS